MINRGPVDVIIMAGGQPRLDGTVLKELQRLSAAGTIRVLDALIVVKNEQGLPFRFELKDLPADIAEAANFIPLETRGLFDTEDADALIEGMAPGSAVFALAIEHVWAVQLVQALDHAGVEFATQFRVPAEEVEEAFASLADNA